MEALKKLFTEEQVLEVSEKILSSTKKKINEQITDAFYSETEGYLFQIYDNFKDKIKRDLISEISESYVKDPANYQFKELRNKIFNENKSEILRSLTDSAISDSLDRILREYTGQNYFAWQWKDAIVAFMIKNWDSFKSDERMAQAFGRELERKQNTIDYLQKKLDEINSIA